MSPITPFDVLLADLRRAKDLYESGAKSDRAGVIASVEAVARFLMTSRSITDPGLQRPLIELLSEFRSLDDGKQSALLTSRKIGGRGREPPLRHILHGLAVCVADEIAKLGLDPRKADESVASELHKLGIKPTRKGKEDDQGHMPRVTSGTIGGWRKSIRKDAAAAQVYDNLKALFSKIFPDDADPSGKGGELTEKHKREIILMQLPCLIRRYKLA